MIKSLYHTFQNWSLDGSIYIYSDPHFGDSDCKFMDPNWPEPDEQVARLNKCLTKNDTLIILGDIGDVSYVKKLKAGHKVLIMGNHDTGRTNYERKTREYDYEFPTIEDAKKAIKSGVIDSFKDLSTYTSNKAWTANGSVNGVETSLYVSPKPWIKGYVDNGLFDEIYEGPLCISEKIVLSHEPVCMTAKLTGEQVMFNIHGHDHSETQNDIYHLNVAANVIGYKPVNLSDVIKNGAISDSKIKSIHRTTIDEATIRKANRL